MEFITAKVIVKDTSWMTKAVTLSLQLRSANLDKFNKQKKKTIFLVIFCFLILLSAIFMEVERKCSSEEY